MEKTYIQLNMVNVLTILLMASVGAALLGFVAAGIQTFWPSGNQNDNLAS